MLDTITDKSFVQALAPFTSRAIAITLSDMKDRDQPLVFCSDAFLQMTGYDRSDVIGRNCRFLQGADRLQPSRSHIKRAISTHQPGTFFIVNYTKAGERFLNLLVLAPLFAPSGGRFMLGCQYRLKPAFQENDLRAHLRRVRGLVNDLSVQVGLVSPQFLASARACSDAVAILLSNNVSRLQMSQVRYVDGDPGSGGSSANLSDATP